MTQYRLYLNRITNFLEIHDDYCKRNKKPDNMDDLELIDTYESDENIQEVYKRYFTTYPSRKIVIADCCK